ncbi:MAG: hypothetical protein WCO52_01035 [bacterium]
MSTVGPRISVIGNSGSGKSTLAIALGEALHIPVHHLDRELLNGNFEKLPLEEYQKAHARLIAGDQWVIDGVYKNAIPERIDRSTLVVFLDVSRIYTFPRVLQRRRRGGQLPNTIPDGAKPERLKLDYIKWTLSYDRRKKKRTLRSLCAEKGVKLLTLKKMPPHRLLEEVLAALPSAI